MPSEDEMILGIRLRSDVARVATEGGAALRAEELQAQATARQMNQLDRATDAYRRSIVETAIAQEAAAAASNKSMSAQLRTSRALFNAQNKQNTAAKEVARLRAKAIKDEKALRTGLNNTDSIIKKLGKSFTSFLMSVLQFGKTGLIFFTKWVTILSGAVPLVVALGTALVSALTSMLPLLGLFAALPAAMGAVAVSAGVLKAAFSGVGGAISEMTSLHPDFVALGEELQKLSPAARTFVGAFSEIKLGPLHELQQSLQQGFFAQFNQSLSKMPKIINSVKGPLTAISGLLGRLGNMLVTLFASKGFQKDLKVNMSIMRLFIGRLGEAGITLIGTFNHIFAYLKPFFEWFTAALEQGAHNFDDWARSDKGKKEIITFFEHTKKVAQETWHIIKTLSEALYNIFKNAGVLSGAMGKGLTKVVDTFLAWTKSAQGQKSIQAFFKSVLAIIKRLLPIAIDVWKILHILWQPQFAEVFAKIVHKILLLLLKMIKIMTNSGAQKAFYRLLLAVIKFVDIFLIKSGLFKVLVQAVVALTIGLAKIFEWMNTHQTIVKWFIIMLNPLGLIMTAVMALLQAFKWVWDKAVQAAKLIGKWWSWLYVHILKPIGHFFGAIWDGILKAANAIIGAVKDIYDHTIKPMIDGIKWVLDHIPDLTGTEHRANPAESKFIRNYLDTHPDSNWFYAVRALKALEDRLGHVLGEPGTPTPGGGLKGAGVPAPGTATRKPTPQVSPVEAAINPWGRFLGGPVTGYHPWLVGEKGAELFRSGNRVIPVGEHGPEWVNFSESGYVFPHEDYERWHNDMRTLASRAGVAGRTSSAPTSVRTTTHVEDYDIHMGGVTIVATDAADMEKQFRAMLARIETENRDRAIKWRPGRS